MMKNVPFWPWYEDDDVTEVGEGVSDVNCTEGGPLQMKGSSVSQ